MKLIFSVLLLGVSLLAQSIFVPNAPTGINARYFGTSGSTSYYYWVQAIYPNGRSSIAGPAGVTVGAASLGNGNKIQVTWRAMPFAQAYDIMRTSTTTPPGGGCNCAVSLNNTNNSLNDNGLSTVSYTTNLGQGQMFFPFNAQAAGDTGNLSTFQLFGGLIVSTPTAAASYTTPSAATLQAAMPNCYIGQAIPFTVMNRSAGANTVTFIGGSAVTLIGTGTVVQNFARNFLLYVTGCGSSAAFNLYSFQTAAF